jgi:hypothetical protein
MKRILWIGILIVLLSGMILGCGPAAVKNNFTGAWTTNIGKVDFQQTGNEVAGKIAGYGGNWNESFTGTVNENGEAVFNTQWFGDFTLVLTGDTFKSKGELSFCGIRASQELPAGCGFSGKWKVSQSKGIKNGSYIVLKQVGADVTGDLFDGNNQSYDTFTGKVEWGKGWRMTGTSAAYGELTLDINAAETGFVIIYGSNYDTQLCAVRDGQASAYLGSFTCAP